MASRPKSSEANTLEVFRVALNNAESQTEIASIMAELGYDSTVIAEGKELLAQTRTAYDFNATEDDETSAAYAGFKRKRKELESMYSMHRKKAKVIFRKDALIADRLAISGSLQRKYINWLETVKKFYGVATDDSEIQSKLTRLKISADDIAAANTLINEIETARAEYLREKGESQDSTKAKDSAFEKIDDWMSEFYAVARIGLEDKPQLLEALGKTVN